MIKFSPERAELLDQVIGELDIAPEKKKMFGHETWFLNGYMFCGANESGVFVHLGKAATDAALESESDVSMFEPMAGRTMKDYLLLGRKTSDNARTLRPWLQRSAEYLNARPPKPARPKKR